MCVHKALRTLRQRVDLKHQCGYVTMLNPSNRHRHRDGDGADCRGEEPSRSVDRHHQHQHRHTTTTTTTTTTPPAEIESKAYRQTAEEQGIILEDTEDRWRAQLEEDGLEVKK
ncbi:hypothetical protein CRUP_030935 [Coryphaenoides rupestris]|nr:hypothetical protein CRUP_030935 [Coryphaenoides rupestris]